MKPTVRERLLSKLVIDPSGCLLWTGTVTAAGYGQISVDGRQEYVHRVMWETFEAPIPDGLTLDHVARRGCHHKHCASIAHLEPVTQRENAYRAVHPNAAKDHCVNKHEYTLANTYFNPRGHRHCRKCTAIQSAAYRERKQARAS